MSLDDALEDALETYIGSQEARPSLTSVVQAALLQFLQRKGIAVRTGKGSSQRKVSRRAAKKTGRRAKLSRG